MHVSSMSGHSTQARAHAILQPVRDGKNVLLENLNASLPLTKSYPPIQSKRIIFAIVVFSDGQNAINEWRLITFYSLPGFIIFFPLRSRHLLVYTRIQLRHNDDLIYYGNSICTLIVGKHVTREFCVNYSYPFEANYKNFVRFKSIVSRFKSMWF